MQPLIEQSSCVIESTTVLPFSQAFCEVYRTHEHMRHMRHHKGKCWYITVTANSILSFHIFTIQPSTTGNKYNLESDLI